MTLLRASPSRWLPIVLYGATLVALAGAGIQDARAKDADFALGPQANDGAASGAFRTFEPPEQPGDTKYRPTENSGAQKPARDDVRVFNHADSPFDTRRYGHGPASAKMRLPRWGMQLRLAPYKPHIASNADVQKVYALMFERPSHAIIRGRPVQVGLEGYLFLYRGLGLLGPYARLSYWTVTGTTRTCTLQDGVTPTACTSQTILNSAAGNDTAALSVVPVSLGALWQIDTLQRSLHVPISFLLKAGVDYHIWWADSGAGSARYRGQPARGATLGYSVAAGVALHLDFFSRATLSRANSNLQNMLFAEFEVVRGSALLGTHRAERLDLSDDGVVVVGLAVNFL